MSKQGCFPGLQKPQLQPRAPRAGVGGAWSPGGDVQPIWGQIFPKLEPRCHQSVRAWLHPRASSQRTGRSGTVRG